MLLTLRAVRAPALRSIRTRSLSSLASASSPSSKTQVYLSRSNDPYLNLSIEHHLLQKTPSDSTVLFLYTNRPCVVIGRNQNPWLEVNLPLINSLGDRQSPGQGPESIDLVRRRSGGGTVFHDLGNVNYSVICPPASFDRDTHAEMVVRALRSLGVDGARVNCRHDIVLDVPSAVLSSAEQPPSPPSCRANAPPDEKEGQLSTFKVSGSAYKITRLRSLHHGTCLLSSPNLGTLGKVLRSPAEGLIKGRGVESVRSPVRNVGVDNRAFEEAVVREFGKMYGAFDVEATVGDDEAGFEGVTKGFNELQSRDWIYGQTPLFTFSTHPTEEDNRPRQGLPGDFRFRFDARHGLVQKISVRPTASADELSLSSLEDSKIYDIQDWAERLRNGGLDTASASSIGGWLNGLFGVYKTPGGK